MKKLIWKTIKAVFYLFGIIIFLLLLYIVFNLNLFHKTKALSKKQVGNYLFHIDSYDPLRFVADKFDDHDIVIIGELHKRKQDLQFFSELIPYLYQTKGIKTIGWEFGATDYQQDADSIVTAPEFDRKKAIALMRNSNYYWRYEDYLNIFKIIWQLNKNIAADSNKIKFLQLNKPYVPRLWNAADPGVRLKERQNGFDIAAPVIVEKEAIQKNKKVLIYCGLHHSLTKFKTPKLFFLKDNDGRAGQRLCEKYPNRIYQICLLSPFPPRWLVYNEFTHRDAGFVYPFDAEFNQLYDSIRKPLAVNSSNETFAGVKDYNSFYAFDRARGVSLKEFCDGAIFLSAFENIEPASAINDWVTTDAELQSVKAVLEDKDAKQIHSIKDLQDFIAVKGNQDEMRKLHALKKFW